MEDIFSSVVPRSSSDLAFMAFFTALRAAASSSRRALRDTACLYASVPRT